MSTPLKNGEDKKVLWRLKRVPFRQNWMKPKQLIPIKLLFKGANEWLAKSPVIYEDTDFDFVNKKPHQIHQSLKNCPKTHVSHLPANHHSDLETKLLRSSEK